MGVCSERRNGLPREEVGIHCVLHSLCARNRRGQSRNVWCDECVYFTADSSSGDNNRLLPCRCTSYTLDFSAKASSNMVHAYSNETETPESQLFLSIW